MRNGIKFVSFILGILLSSESAKSQQCPSNWPYKCPNGQCVQDENDCAKGIVHFSGNPGIVYIFPSGTYFFCTSRKDIEPSVKDGMPFDYWGCPTTPPSPEPTKQASFVAEPHTLYSLEPGTRIVCKSGQPPQEIASWKRDVKYYVCPSKGRQIPTEEPEKKPKP